MTKLLIYIAEGQKFDLQKTISAITSIDGVYNVRIGKFIGAVFECEYHLRNLIKIVHISETEETVTIEGDEN